MRKLQRVIKRLFDLLLSTFSLIFALPIMGIIIIFIRICSPESSAIFKQERVGYKNKLFILYKLRSMTNERDQNGELLPDEFRLKKWGKVIRKLSLDELPQIGAIFLGKMSWVGPRPLLKREMSVMTKKEQEERQSMLPGITGWEAVNEEKSDSRRRMAEFDLEYVRNWSLAFDVKIILKTAGILLRAGRAEDELRAPKMKVEEIISEEKKGMQ